jgi:UPF0176 protein
VPAEDYNILLYYLYAPIEDAAAFVEEQIALCESLELRGRIIVAAEGLNGTVSGSVAACEEYVRVMHADPRLPGMEFKVDAASEHAFPKLSVKLRSEVVSLGLGEDDFFPPETTGEYLEPAQWREMMERDDVVLLDARNNYEWELGRFEGAVLPDIDSFRELPNWVRHHREELEGKKILTYCTGGIRCEKFSGFLKREGFQDVYQLHGGIVKYGKDRDVRGEKFEGKCYVFDERIGVEVNEVDRKVVGECLLCGTTSDRYLNCAWPCCNAQYFCCEACEKSATGYCSPTCQDARIAGLCIETTDR